MKRFALGFGIGFTEVLFWSCILAGILSSMVFLVFALFIWLLQRPLKEMRDGEPTD